MGLTELYLHRGYLDVHSGDFLISMAIVLVITGATGYANYQAMLMSIRSKWDVYRCNPLIMPFAGQVMPIKGVPSGKIVGDNFQYCLKKDASIALSIAVMPLEFTLYAAMESLNTLQHGVDDAMALTTWVMSQITAEYEKIMNMIKSFIVPIVVIIKYVQDALAKTNAVLTTSLYVVMNLFNLIVSGTINLMKILSNIIIAFTVIMLALAILAFVLIPTPATALGWSIYASAATLLMGNIIPGIVVYTILRLFITSISDAAVASAPKTPSLKSKKK